MDMYMAARYYRSSMNTVHLCMHSAIYLLLFVVYNTAILGTLLGQRDVYTFIHAVVHTYKLLAFRLLRIVFFRCSLFYPLYYGIPCSKNIEN